MDDPEHPKTKCLSSTNYKTSFLYGEKHILVPEEVYVQMCIYKDYLRDYLILDSEKKDSERYLFNSSKKTADNPMQQLTQSTIANLLTQTFKDAGVGVSFS